MTKPTSSYAKRKAQMGCVITVQLISDCLHYIDDKIFLLPKYETSSLESSSVPVQPGLYRTWSKTLKTGFVMAWLILSEGWGHLGEEP